MKIYAIMQKIEGQKDWGVMGITVGESEKPEPAITFNFESAVGIAMAMQEGGIKGHHIVEFVGKLPDVEAEV